MATREFVKLNKEPIKLQWDEFPYREVDAYFEFEGEVYGLADFVRVHNNAWIHDNFPEYIHGYYGNNHYYPFYVEILDDLIADAVNVYTEIWAEDEEVV